SENINTLLIKKYILTVSSHHPRKNFNRLLDAFERIEDQDLHLYIIGNMNKHFVNNSNKNNCLERVVFLNNISDNQLVEFYKKSKLFVYPSLYEGFGIPIIEALCLNIPVLVSNIPIFNEVCGENASYFDPKSTTSIYNCIIKNLENAQPNSSTIAEAIKLKYSWSKSGDVLYEILKKFVDKNNKLNKKINK
uniref:glycosyltransferase n=1 Tax=Flavobacterium sp. TaxID=239 RepID=UPI0040498AFF